MGIPFFILFVLSIAFLSLGLIGWGDFLVLEWDEEPTPETAGDAAGFSFSGTPYLSLQPNASAIARCIIGFLLFFTSLYFMGFFLYLEERESGRIMKNVKSFAKLRRFLDKRKERKAAS